MIMPQHPKDITKPLSKYALIIFDLDGTLAPSKEMLGTDIADALIRLVAKTKVAIISGGGLPQFQTQFINRLPTASASFANLYLLPTSGTKLYVWRGSWNEEYSEQLSAQEKKRAIDALKLSLAEAGFRPPYATYGDAIEDRGSQITFSALGQRAPIGLKSAWDPDRSKREKIVGILKEKIPGFDVRIGGSTSIDITKRGINKAYGIRKLESFLKLDPEKILFVGDALFPGGNDFPAKATGVDCVQVGGPDDTKRLIESLLA
jgi:phosphomannomutase